MAADLAASHNLPGPRDEKRKHLEWLKLQLHRAPVSAQLATSDVQLEVVKLKPGTGIDSPPHLQLQRRMQHIIRASAKTQLHLISAPLSIPRQRSMMAQHKD
jgi:hypothetical protein